MARGIFEDSVNIRFTEMDCNLILKPSFLLQFMQDLAADNAESLGFGYTNLSKQNLGWYLIKYHMEFNDYPQDLKKIRLTTEPRGYNKIFALRDFGIYDGENVLGKIASTWTLVDISSKSLMNIPKTLPTVVPFEPREDDLSYNKIKVFENVDKEKIFEIRYDDIDTNQHVNNSNYIVWAFEVLDFDFRHLHKLKTLDIVFKKDIQYGSKVLSQVQINNNTTTHMLKNAESGEDLCLILAEWVEI